jgi:AcrR family transcriptional regulator
MNKHKQAIRERKNREKDQRIQTILEAAKKLFFSKGYIKTTMDEIALEAQISKPTVYQYFATKDELYSYLMLPFLEEFGRQFESIEKKLSDRKYLTGRYLVKDLFKIFVRSYKKAPDSLRVANTFFQHRDLIDQLNPESRSILSSKGKYDFEIARRIIDAAIAQGLFKNINGYALSDIIWALFLGITQVMDMKATKHPQSNKYLKNTLDIAENMIADAIVLK